MIKQLEKQDEYHDKLSDRDIFFNPSEFRRYNQLSHDNRIIINDMFRTLYSRLKENELKRHYIEGMQGHNLLEYIESLLSENVLLNYLQNYKCPT